MTNGSHIREEDLELYALGALPENEAAAVKAHVGGCGECARKLAEARGRVALLAFAAPAEKPSSEAKGRLLALIAAEKARGGRGASSERRMGGTVKEEEKVKTPWWNWVVVPAAVALAVVCVLLSVQNRRLISELRRAREAAAEFRKERVRAQELIHVLVAPDTITVKLEGTPEAAQARGVVKYNQRLGTLLYSAEELPPLPADKVYEMWLVPSTGAPIDAGVFAAGENGNEPVWRGQVPANTEPKAFAVTVEAAGGAKEPKGPKVLLGAK